MDTKINHGATNVTRRSEVRVTRNVDGSVAKVYGRDEWDRVQVVHFNGSQQIDVHTSTEFETWHHATACLVTVGVAEIVKTCGCGRSFTAEQWAALESRGIQETEDETGKYALELRNCTCGSTIGVERKAEF